MASFEEFYDKLTTGEGSIWFDNVKTTYARKNIKKAFNEGYIWLLTQDQRWKTQDYADYRRAMGKFLAYAKEELQMISLQQKEPEQQKPQAPIVEGKERDEWIQKWLELTKNCNTNFRVTRDVTLTKEQIEEEGQIRQAKKAINYVPPPTEEMELRERIRLICKERFKDRPDYWNLKLHEVNGFQFMAESKEQAQEIFNEANL